MQKEYGVTLRNENRGNTFRPNLPKPKTDRPFKIIRFSKSDTDIKTVIGFLYGDPEENIPPSTVGEKCFDSILNTATKGE